MLFPDVHMYCPRRTLMKLGNKIARSLPTAVELDQNIKNSYLANSVKMGELTSQICSWR